MIDYNFCFLLKTQPQEFLKELLSKTQSLFPSLSTAQLSPLLLHSKAVSAYDAVWTIASAWESLLANSQLCDNATALTNRMESALAKISVSNKIILASMPIMTHDCSSGVSGVKKPLLRLC